MTSVQHIAVPRILDLEAALAFAGQLAALSENTLFLGVDFSAWNSVQSYELPLRPFGMLIVSQAIRQLKIHNPAVIFAPVNLQ